MSAFKELKLNCYRANMQLPELKLVTYTFGNVSLADHKQKVFAIKPSGVPYDQLSTDDMVVMDFNNNIIEGELRPSSDTKTHAHLYRTWPSVGGISHTHATYSVAWAQALKAVPILGTTHADHLTVDIPCTPPLDDELITGDYELSTGLQITDYFRDNNLDPRQVEMVLVGSHGPFTWGRDASQAVYNSKTLEELAKMALITLQINPQAPRLKDALIKKHHNRKHGDDAYYGQE